MIRNLKNDVKLTRNKSDKTSYETENLGWSHSVIIGLCKIDLETFTQTFDKNNSKIRVQLPGENGWQ